MRIPYGVSVHHVDAEHPYLIRCPLLIEASPENAKYIFSKLWDYRLWYHLRDEINTPHEFGHGDIFKAIQDAFYWNEAKDPDFANGVSSVTILFPKSLESRIIKQLAHLPSPLFLGEEPFRKMARKVAHIQNRNGNTRSLAIIEECLDIETDTNSDLILVLNNLSDPAWGMLIGESPIDVSLLPRDVLNINDVSEEAAWTRVASWMRFKGISVFGQEQYPNGENSFPDYKIIIEGKTYDIEITSVPNLSNWTIKSSNRDLEKTIQRVARQRGETIDDVDKELVRILGKKSARIQSNPCLLIVTNWSSHSLKDLSFWTDKDLSKFKLIIVIEWDMVWCTNGISIWN